MAEEKWYATKWDDEREDEDRIGPFSSKEEVSLAAKTTWVDTLHNGHGIMLIKEKQAPLKMSGETFVEQIKNLYEDDFEMDEFCEDVSSRQYDVLEQKLSEVFKEWLEDLGESFTRDSYENYGNLKIESPESLTGDWGKREELAPPF